jgi:hypothetical protein
MWMAIRVSQTGFVYTDTGLQFFVVYEEEKKENFFLMHWRITSDSYIRFRGHKIV